MSSCSTSPFNRRSMYVPRGLSIFRATRRLNIDPPSSYRGLDQLAMRVRNAEVVTPVVVHLQLTVLRVPLVDSFVATVPAPPTWLPQVLKSVHEGRGRYRDRHLSCPAFLLEGTSVTRMSPAARGPGESQPYNKDWRASLRCRV